MAYASYDEKIASIQYWAQTKPWFDTALVDSLEEWARSRDLTMRQEQAIDNIIKKFHIRRPVLIDDLLRTGRGLTVSEMRLKRRLFATS